MSHAAASRVQPGGFQHDPQHLPVLAACCLCRSDSSLLRLVKDYPRTAPPAERCAFISQELGLQGPSDPDRLFAVGQFMPSECWYSSSRFCLEPQADAQACAVGWLLTRVVNS